MMETKRKISRADQAEQRKKDLLKVGPRLFSESDKVDVFLNGIRR